MEHPSIESVYSTNNVDSWWSQCYVWQYFLSKITWQWQWKVFNVYRQRCLVEATRGPIHCLVNGQSFSCHHISHHFTSHNCWQTFSLTFLLQLQTKVREDFTIKEKVPTGAFSWLKAPTSASFMFKTLFRPWNNATEVPRLNLASLTIPGHREEWEGSSHIRYKF